tara:strand:+ start:226 stop:3339 length:3114 start_codon:yes stop_codon:yes gene_type:complete
MKNQDLINALRNEGRQPVDLNLGQVPVSPTIGRMGNYNVVVKGFSTRNAATELSAALAQMPQFLGQARNIQETAGKQAANELTTEQVIDRLKKGDLEAQGFLTQFGKDKAFAEQVYQRWFDSTIKASIINASSQIDNKSPEELLEMGEGDVFTENARNLLVSSITGGDPTLLDKIAANPHTARLHNKAMEGVIPEFTAKAAATAEARKQKFARDSALSNVSSDFLSLVDVDIVDYVRKENHEDAQHKVAAEKFRTEQLDAYVANVQEALKVSLQNPDIATEDRDKAMKTAVDALRSKMGLLLEQEDTDVYGAVLNAMQDGSLKIDGKPFEQSPEGIKQLIYAESALEEYEDKLARENERGDFDRNKVDKWKVENLRQITAPINANPNSSPAAFQAGIEKLNTFRRALTDQEGQLMSEFTSTEIEHLLATIGDTVTSLEQSRDGRLSTTMLMKASPDYKKLETQTGLGLSDFVEQQTNNSIATMRERAEKYGFTDAMESLITDGIDEVTGKPYAYAPFDVSSLPEQAHDEAMAIALEKPFQELQDGDLDLSSQEKIQAIRDVYNEQYEAIYTEKFKKIAGDNGFIKGAAVEPTDKTVGRMLPEEAEEALRRKIADSGYPLEDNGKLTYDSKTERVINAFSGEVTDETTKTVNTANAWKMVNDPDAVKVLKDNNTETQRLDFNRIWLSTKYSKQAKQDRAAAIMKKPQAKHVQAKIWEIQQSRSTGLPMEILRTDRGRSATHYYREVGGLSGFFGFRGDKLPFSIDYEDDLIKKDAPETRIFNVNAVYKAVRQNDFEDLIFIATEYGHAPKGSSVNSPEIQSFLKKQKKLVSERGYMDFVEPLEFKEKTLEDYEELYKNSAITDPPKEEEGASPVSETVAPNLKENEESVEAKITGTEGDITIYSPQKGGDKMEGGYPSARPGPDGKSLVRTVQDYANGKSKYITLAGNPTFYNKSYVIPELPYEDPKTGEQTTLRNVPAVVHDTGGAFKTKPEFRYDIPLGKDLTDKEMTRYNGILKKKGIQFVESVEPREGGPVDSK